MRILTCLLTAAATWLTAAAPPAHAAEYTMKIGFITRGDQNEDWAN